MRVISIRAFALAFILSSFGVVTVDNAYAHVRVCECTKDGHKCRWEPNADGS